MTREEIASLIIEYQENLYRLAFSFLKNDADAQDAVGETIVKAFENREHIRKKERVKAWLMQILANEARTMLRKKKRLQLTDEPEIFAPAVPFQSDELWPIVMELPEEFRVVVILYYYEQLSVREVSKVLKVSEGTIKSRLARARQKLMQYMEK